MTVEYLLMAISVACVITIVVMLVGQVIVAIMGATGNQNMVTHTIPYTLKYNEKGKLVYVPEELGK